MNRKNVLPMLFPQRENPQKVLLSEGFVALEENGGFV